MRCACALILSIGRVMHGLFVFSAMHVLIGCGLLLNFPWSFWISCVVSVSNIFVVPMCRVLIVAGSGAVILSVWSWIGQEGYVTPPLAASM